MINIILTIDYEIFGRGYGDVKEHMINPTNSLLEICDKYSAPMTIMFEFVEYLKFKEFDAELQRDLGYSPAGLIKSQVKNAFERGHDLQLHLHPQWIDADYNEGKWIMKNPTRKITDLGQKAICNLLNRGKSLLHEMVGNIDKNYQCNVLRLTNMPWDGAPYEVIPSMIKNNFVAHSLSLSDTPENISGYWPLYSKDIFEIPIHSITSKKIKMFTPMRIWAALHRTKFNKISPFPNEGLDYQTSHNASNSTKKSFIDSFLNLFNEDYPLKWDFCKQSSNEMIHFLEIGIQKYKNNEKDVPLVMIGHSKDFFNRRAFEIFLKYCSNKYSKHIKFSSFQDFVDRNIA